MNGSSEPKSSQRIFFREAVCDVFFGNVSKTWFENIRCVGGKKGRDKFNATRFGLGMTQIAIEQRCEVIIFFFDGKEKTKKEGKMEVSLSVNACF